MKLNCEIQDRRIKWEINHLWARPRAIAVISFLGKPAKRPSNWDLMQRMSS